MRRTHDTDTKERTSMLSKANLEMLQTVLREETKFVEGQIRQEAAQQYQQALYGFRAKDQRLQSARAGEELATVANLYRPDQPSNMSPMKRFCTVSTNNEPTPLIAKQAMEKMRVAIGSLETIDARSRAAKDAAGEPEIEAEPEIDGAGNAFSMGDREVEDYRRAKGDAQTKVGRDIRQKKKKSNEGRAIGDQHKRRRSD